MSTPIPPPAPRRPHYIHQHGLVRVDDYYWLRRREDPAVMAYIEAENAYTAQVTAHTQSLQEQLYAEMKGRMPESDVSAPERNGPYFYYTRLEAGRQYPMHCRRRESMDAVEEVLLDENELAAGQPFLRVGVFEISPDHTLLAYSVDHAGDEVFTLAIKDLRAGQLTGERIPNTSYGVVWANDSRTLFYSTLDAAKRPHKVFRHTAGTDAAQDALVYHETDETYSVSVAKTSSKAYLLLYVWGGDTSEVHYASADQPAAGFKVLQPRRRGVEYSLSHHGDLFYIVTNEDALNFRLMAAPVSHPERAAWQERIPNRSEVMLDSILIFRDFLLRIEREGGFRHLRISNIDGSDEREVHFPEPVYAVFPAGNPEFDSREARFYYSSLVTPYSVVDYDMDTQRWQVKKQEQIPSGYDPQQYVSEQLAATAPDGRQVPISIVYRKGFAHDGSHPLLLTAYGSYGISNDPFFDTNRLSLLDRGFAVAIAHVRGGAELGRAWFEDGRLLHKKNTFTDLIASAEYLIARGYTRSARLAIMGGSAGGLLMGAAVNRRPDLFRAVIADVPFVDVVNTMSDAGIPLTAIEYSQWGDPADKAMFDYMMSYSPYDNVQARDYPDMLITGGLDDPRVAYWEPLKWAARLRALKTDRNLLLLKMNLHAGHAGASGRYSHLREVAFKYAFLIDRLESANHRE